MEQLLVSLVLAAAGGALVVLCGLRMLQMYQLCSYQSGGFFRWIRRSGGDYPIRYFALGFFQFISLMIFGFCFPDSWLRYLGLVLYFGLAVYFIILQFSQKKRQKTPLVVTKRMARLISALFVLGAGLSFVSVYFVFGYAIWCAPLAVITVLIPLIVTIAHFVMLPLESAIAAHYKRRAKKALAGGIIKVGITGSFGKTTAKNILAAMLGKKYRVLSSPASHNTPMGICKLVNNADGDFDVLIAELGARHKGDIAELCEFIRPHYGIITVTGAQHLETFGDLPTIVRTKLELAEYASELVVLNSDDERLVIAAGALKESLRAGKNSSSDKNWCASAGCACGGDSREDGGTNGGTNCSTNDTNGGTNCSTNDTNGGINCGTNDTNGGCFDARPSAIGALNDEGGGACRFLYSGSEGSDAGFEDVQVSPDGTSFVLRLGSEKLNVSTKLLGRHLPSLFAECALLASKMGVSAADIAAAAQSVQPIPHRLQLIRTKDCTVIDDAYNSNPEGARNALEVLSLFSGVRVVVTPGFVELGAVEREENKILGRRAAECADYLLSVGSADVALGAREAGMDSARVFEDESLNAAMERLASLGLSSPTVLFLNDLPDSY